MLDNASRRGHCVLDVVDKARDLRGRDMWALALPLFGDTVKLIVRDKGATDVLLYTECSGADALKLLEYAGFDLTSHELEHLVRTLRGDGLSMQEAVEAALALHD